MNRRPPRSTLTHPLFPYTTRFRSRSARIPRRYTVESLTTSIVPTSGNKCCSGNPEPTDDLVIVRFALCRSVVAVVPEDCVDRLAGPLVRGRQQVGVSAQGEARVAVAQVLAERLDRFPAVEERARVEVPQCMRSDEHTSELQSLMRISYAV